MRASAQDVRPLREVRLLSHVGGGPMERLARHLPGAAVHAAFTPERWRRAMASGRTARVLARLEAFGLYPWQALAEALRMEGGVLVPTTNPFVLPGWLVLTRPLHGKRVVPLVYDLYPDAIEAAGMGRPTGLLARSMERFNRWWLGRADGVVFIGERMAEHATARYGRPRRATVLETGADAEELDPGRIGRDPRDSWARWAGERVLFSYVGNLGHVHDWATLPPALDALDPAKAAVLVAASGPGLAHWRRVLASFEPELVRFEPPLPDDAWARLLVRSEVAVVTLRPEAHRTCVPSKALSAMAAGCALLAIAPADSDLADLVERHGCGVRVEPGDVEGLREAFRRLQADEAARARMQRAARQAVLERYDMRVLTRRWEAFLDEVMASAAPPEGYDALKRALDVAGATAGLALTSPLLLPAMLAVRLTMGSPVFFRQARPGKDGRPFELLKLRTMRQPRPGEEGPEHDAARLTRLGRLLRRTSIDELPTLLNVLRGEMSLVGPRPLLMRYLSRYTPRQARRHEVKPGVTGWAQIHGRNATSWEARFEHDVWYVENRALLLDLRILWRTVFAVLRREGIEQPGHATMPEFLGNEGPAAEAGGGGAGPVEGNAGASAAGETQPAPEKTAGAA